MKILLFVIIPAVIYSQEIKFSYSFPLQDNSSSEVLEYNAAAINDIVEAAPGSLVLNNTDQTKSKIGIRIGTLFPTGSLVHQSHFAADNEYDIKDSDPGSGFNLNLKFFYEFHVYHNLFLSAGIEYLFLNKLEFETMYQFKNSNEGESIYHYDISAYSSLIPFLGVKYYFPINSAHSLSVSSEVGAKMLKFISSELIVYNSKRGYIYKDHDRSEASDKNNIVVNFGMGYKYKNLSVDFSFTPKIYSFEQEKDITFAATGDILSANYKAWAIGVSYITAF